MLERFGDQLTSEEVADRSDRLARLAADFEDLARQHGFSGGGANCRRECKERLEVVNGRLQVVVVCYTICD